jgi:hypothetical protein
LTANASTVNTFRANVGSFYTWANNNFGTSNYSNATVAAYLLTSNVIIGINANLTAANSAITDANIAMKSYVDGNAAVQYAQILGANAAIVTANTGMKSYVDSQITTANTAMKAYVDANAAVQSANIGTLFSNAASQYGDIATLYDTTGTHTTQIATLFSNAASQANSITTLQSQVNGPVLMAYNSSKQSLATGATVLKYSTTTINTSNYYNTSTGLFTPLVAGYYQVNLTMAPELVSGSPEAIFQLGLYKNGTIVSISPTCQVTSTTPILSNNNVSAIVYLNGTTDYLSVAYISTIVSGTWRTAVNGVSCYFQAVWIRGA